MSVEFAFNTVACPEWTLEKVVERAREWGYAGVELRTLGPGDSGLTSDPALSTPQKVAAAFKGSGVTPLCLSTSHAFHYRDSTRTRQTRFGVMRSLEDAASMGCRYVRVFGNEVGPGEDRRSVLQRIAANLAPVLDKATELRVEILFENAGSYATAKEWWWLLEMVGHPMVGLCWNIANSAAVDPNDRGGWVSVPMLNHRIRVAKVKDTRIGEGSGYTQLGEGTVGIEALVKRLYGVGFEGYVSVEWDRLWLGALAPAEEYLPEALGRLKKWCEEIDEAEAQGRAAREKAAAKNAPKPRKVEKAAAGAAEA